MKNYLTLFIILFFNNNLQSQKYNLSLSIRPSNIFSNDIIENSKDNYIKSQTFSVKPFYKIEYVKSNNTFHLLYLGVFYKRNNFISKKFSDNVLTYKKEVFTNFYTGSIGYGFGKYYELYKKNLFIKLQNSLIFSSEIYINYQDETNKFSDNTLYRIESLIPIKIPKIQTMRYEVMPALCYSHKSISLELGLPVFLSFNYSKGYNESKLVIKDVLSKKEREIVILTETNYNYLNFNYEIELSFKFHFKSKK